MTRRGKYLFNARNLTKVFRARFHDEMARLGIQCPASLPSKWVVDCRRMGQGLSALKYLSRYLYRGVISERYLLSDDGENISFHYRESNTHQLKTRTLAGEDFLYLLLQHVLPKDFRRSRDYGFLHGNAKTTLHRVQWCLAVNVPLSDKPKGRPQWRCADCGQKMTIVAIHVRRSG